jgi:hypothetical protein
MGIFERYRLRFNALTMTEIAHEAPAPSQAGTPETGLSEAVTSLSAIAICSMLGQSPRDWQPTLPATPRKPPATAPGAPMARPRTPLPPGARVTALSH